MSRGQTPSGAESENIRLREELRSLREDLRHLTLRVDRQGDQLSDSFSVLSSQSLEVASSAGAASSAPPPSQSGGSGQVSEPIDPVGPYSWALRDSVAREIGAFLKRCLEGGHRGESGRDRIKGLQSRIYIVVRDYDRRVYNPPLLLKTFTEVKNYCKRDGSCGDSIFIGVLSDPGLHSQSDTEGAEPAVLGPRDFVVAQEDGTADHFYRVGRLTLAQTGLVTAVIAVADIDGKLLVAVPEPVWNKTVAKRLLPQRALSKPLLCAVAACPSDKREVLGFDTVDIKAWFGLLHPMLEGDVNYVGEEEIQFGFNPEGEELLFPYGPALMEVAQAHFSFATADEGMPREVPVCPPVSEERFQKLELAMEGVQQGLQQLLGERVGSKAKSLAKPLPPPSSNKAKKPPSERLQKATELVRGLEPEVVQSALAAGIPMAHLQEMGAILQGKPRRIEELPRAKGPVRKRQGPLSESEDEEEVDPGEGELPLDESGAPGGGSAQRTMEQAIVQLTAIASQLAGPKDKHKIESLLDGGNGGVGGSESSTGGSGRKNAAAMRALQKCLVEDPKYLYKIMEANLQSDFLSRPVQPGEPLASGTTVRGWLASRSRIQLYHNHVRWAWQTAGIWDCLISNRIDEARARCALLIAAADQASIDGGNWVVSNVALLEAPPPYQSFAPHQAPSPLELQHSVLYDQRWAETFLGHLKDVDSFVDAKKKLGSGKGAQKDASESSGGPPKAKPKAKAKEKGDRGRKGQESAPQDGGGSNQP
eukprot:s453_g13.t1